MEKIHHSQDVRQEGDTHLRRPLFERIKTLGLIPLSVAFVGCTPPAGMSAEGLMPDQSKKPSAEQSQPKKTIGKTIGDVIEKALYPDVESEFTEEEEQEIGSSEIADAIRSLEGTFSGKEIDAVLEQLPLLHTRARDGGGERILAKLHTGLLKDLAKGNLSVSVALPSPDEMQKNGLAADRLTTPIFKEAADEWNVRYGRIPARSSGSNGASLTCTFVPVKSIAEFNNVTGASGPKVTIGIPKIFDSPVIGAYENITDREIFLPAISPDDLFGDAKVPDNVRARQYEIAMSKMFQSQFFDKLFDGGQIRGDTYDIGYSAGHVYAFSMNDALRESPGVISVLGDDGKEYAIVTRNSQIKYDKSNLLVRAVMELVSMVNF